MNELKEIAKEAESILVAGHKRPDGDCVGACFAVYYYLKKNVLTPIWRHCRRFILFWMKMGL